MKRNVELEGWPLSEVRKVVAKRGQLLTVCYCSKRMKNIDRLLVLQGRTFCCGLPRCEEIRDAYVRESRRP